MKTNQTIAGVAAILSLLAIEDAGAGLNVPVEYHKLDNGLKVVLSPDHTTPKVTVAVYYHIGFRNEPRGRTGFAHLFEHMMFQGSGNLGKMEFIQLVESSGGNLNGSTRFDFTNYFDIVPSHKLETILWAEADRMRSLDITEENLVNQKGVVSNEVKVNVLNRPYGGFPWLDMPQYANENWHNAHNFYGELAELEAATLEDVRLFFDTYYSPNNAVLVVTGDFDSKEALGWVDEYFSSIPASELPEPPDLTEPIQLKEKRASKGDPLASKPALAVSFHMPERNTPAFYAMGVIDQILLQGDASRLTERLVKSEGVTGHVAGGINALGSMYNYYGPMLWTASLRYDRTEQTDDILSMIEEEIEGLEDELIDEKTLQRALTRIRSDWYDRAGSSTFRRADLLASFALFDDDPARINGIEEEFFKVTPELIRKTVREYLGTEKRTVLTIVPEAGDEAENGGRS